MTVQLISKEYDSPLAGLIRTNLEEFHLDIPGTAYYDESLDHLSEYYLADPDNRAYYCFLEDGKLIGGVGLSRFEGEICELQKLYLDPAFKGRGYGYVLMEHIENKAREMGFTQMYLETHTNLEAALHLYEKCGYRRIPRPDSVVHSTMNRFLIKNL